WFALHRRLVNYTRGSGTAERHPLILDGLSVPPRAPGGAEADGKSACTFYLVFKEPAGCCLCSPSGLSSSGEPYNTTGRLPTCQPLLPPVASILTGTPAAQQGTPQRKNGWDSERLKACPQKKF